MSTLESGVRLIDELDDHPEMARLVGSIIIAWSNAERTIFFWFWVLTGGSQVVAFNIYERITSMKVRFELIDDLLENRSDLGELDYIRNQFNTLKNGMSFRNMIVHRPWGKTKDGQIILIRPSFRRKGRAEYITEKDIEDAASEVRIASSNLIFAVQRAFPDAFKPS